MGHSDVRNFECQICKRSFKWKSDCIRHEEEHLGVKNFKCIKCGKSFSRHYNAQFHENNCCQKDVSVSDSYSDDGLSDLTDNGVCDDEKI